MLNENYVINLNKNVLKRYEHNMKDGILFLYNVETEDIWMGNESSNDLIRLIDGERTLKEIYENLMPFFEGYEYSAVKESFDEIINDLVSKSFLEAINN